MLKVIPCLILFCLLCAAAPGVSALTITSDAPGNIFVAGSPIRLDIKDTQGDVSYEIVDYFGANVSSGKMAAIELPGLKPGWYEIKCKDAAGETSTTFGVVMDRGNAPLPEDGRVCTDVAVPWVVKENAYKPIAQMVRMAGIPWMRGRLGWGGVEKERGSFNWGNYQTAADTFAAEGIRICQAWHDSPVWTHPSEKDSRCPDDLRDVYNFCRTSASHFSRQIQAWEIRNEEDGNGWLSHRYAGVLKAAYWGIKDGNPQAMVLLGSLCRGVTPFANGVYECAADYFDVFNWHIYSKPSIYPGAMEAHLNLLRKYGAADRPIWVTESGIETPGEGPDNLLLNSQNQRLQCQFMPRSAAMILAVGTDKNFYFILPTWVSEGGNQYGALHTDLTPYPAFFSLSAAANILGLSEYKGEYKTGNDAIVAQVFSTPKGNVLVAWSDTESEMVVPTDKRTVQVANIFGDESSLAAENGELKVKVGPDAIYLLDIGKPIEKKLTGKPRPRGKLPKLNPSRIVLAGSADMPMFRDPDAYIIPDVDVFDYNVEVYNFNGKGKAKGTVEVVPPVGWFVEDAKRSVTVGAMGREVITFRVRPGTPDMSRCRLTVRAKFGKDRVAPCITGFSFDLAALTPVRRQSLDWAVDPARWERLTSPNGTLLLSNPEPGMLHFDVSFNSKADKWAYPTLKFEKPMDMSAFDGIAFNLKMLQGDPTTAIRLMLVEPNGSHYDCATHATSDKRRVVFLFRDLERLEFMGSDPNGHFDADTVSAVRPGCNAVSERVVLEWSDFELVKFNKP